MRANRWLGLLALAALAGDPAAAETHQLCGDDHWFSLDSPEGWELSDDFDGNEVALTLHPRGEAQPAVAVVMPVRSTSLEARAVDLDAELRRWIRLVGLYASPSEIRDWDMRHPTRPTRSAVVEGGAGRLYLSAVDAGSGRGHVFVVFAGEEGPASGKAPPGFRQILASLRFDPTRICAEGPDGGLVEQRITPPPAPPAAAAPEPAAAAAFPAARALEGCGLLQQLFVPVSCDAARAGERPVEVVEFADGHEPASTYLARHRDRVASTWCWAARGRSDAPMLLFGTRGGDAYREYSCETSDWGHSVRAEQLSRGR